MDIVVAITLFVLALLIGVEVIGKVPATLHTPLMSGANSIHGIVIAGVVIVAAHATSPLAWVFIFLAAVLGTMNVVGGYVVTDRMLEMFKSDKGKKKEEEAPAAPCCPFCLEEVKVGATRCPHCAGAFDAPATAE